MLLRLSDANIHLISDSKPIRASWQSIFANGPRDSLGNTAAAQLSLKLALGDNIQPPLAEHRIYRDPRNIVDVYEESGNTFALHFRAGALVRLAPDRSNSATGQVDAAQYNDALLEDVTYTALAPLLRRRRRYLLHAAAVHNTAGAVLMVGPTQSGKSTTGLALVLAGWKHLASDVILLSSPHGQVIAHPTVGLLSARPKSFRLLPDLRRLLPDPRPSGPVRDVRYLMLSQEHWGRPAPVVAICFPELTAAERSTIQPMPASVALARLMEESVDLWDSASLSKHMTFLESLCRQAPAYRLSLAPDVENLPKLMASIT